MQDFLDDDEPWTDAPVFPSAPLVRAIDAMPGLNEGQLQAADGFFKFLFSGDKELRITGRAGRGKTYLLTHMFEEVFPRYLKTCKLMNIDPLFDEVLFAATTNMATEVLGHALKRPIPTVHSLLGLTIKFDAKTGRSMTVIGSRWKVLTRKIIIIDEAFYVDSELYRLMLEGTQDCKLIYVGDPYQISPVSEAISPLALYNFPTYELTQPMRNANQPYLVEVCDELYRRVVNCSFGEIPIVPGVIDLLDGPAIEAEIAATFGSVKKTRDHRILAYTNARVMEYNEHIRDLRGLPYEYGPDELLVNNHAISVGRNMLNTDETVEIVDQSSAVETAKYTDHTEQEIKVEFRRSVLLSGSGLTYNKVPVPTNRHYINELLVYLRKIKDYRLLRTIRETYPDLRPSDASTFHKAQGSTVDTVFIDLENLSTCRQPDMVRRLLYVGFSRARKRVVLYGNLAEKYGTLTFPFAEGATP